MSELDGRTAPRQRFNLRSLLSRCPPCLHHRRQLLPYSWAHRLTARGSLLGWHSLLWSGSTLLLCPACSLRRGNLSPCRCTHGPTFLFGYLYHLASLEWTAPAWGLGARPHQSCNCPFDTACFLSKLCHYVLNVHVVLSVERWPEVM